MLETLTYLCLGIGLAAACGFRVFVPLLGLGVLSRVEWVEVGADFSWVQSTPALIVLSVATLLEVAAYYLPWLDNLLDTISVPAATIAGVVATAAVTDSMHPVLQWSLAAIGGGGTAGTIKLGLSGLRLGSSLLTGGLGNPLVSTFEWIGAVVMSLLAVLLPVLSFFLALILVVLLVRFSWRFIRWRMGRAQDRELDADKTGQASLPPKVVP